MWNAHQVAKAGRDLLKDYLHGYIGVIERRYQLDAHLPVPKPEAYIATAQPDTGVPAANLGNTRVYVICPGVAEAPEETPEQGYNAAYALIVGIEVLSRKNRTTVDAHLGYYQEAIRECVLREGTKVYGNTVIDWTDENTDLGSPDMALTEGAGQTGFSVYLPEVVADTGTLFPDGPPVDPYEPLPGEPLIDQITYEITNTSIDDEL